MKPLSVLFFLPAACAGWSADERLPDPVLLQDLDPGDANLFRRSIERREWAHATVLAGRIAEAGGLVPLGEDPEILVGDALDAPEFLMRTVAAAPRELAEECRRQWDLEALRATERGLTRQSWERYWICTGMDVEGDRLAAELHDDGRSMEAFAIWRAILLYLPDTGLAREVVAARMIHAAAIAGEPAWIDLVPKTVGSVREGNRLRDVAELLEEHRPAPPSVTRLREGLPAGLGLTLKFTAEEGLTVVSYVLTRETGESELLAILGAGVLRMNGTLPLGRMSPGTLAPLDLVLLHSTHRLLWICGGQAAGLVELDTMRQVWKGPPQDAPVPQSWRARSLEFTRVPRLTRKELENDLSARMHSGFPYRWLYRVR